MDPYFFTIIIPTYNRGEILRENLSYLLPLVKPYSARISVYVSDNASTDNTQEIVHFFLSEYSELLFYYRQKENIGANANFKHAVQNVNSEYVCLLGDDDIILPTYFKTIIDILRNNPNIGLIHYNYYMGSLDFKNSELVYKDIIFSDGSFSIIYNSGKEFIYDKLRGPSLMSSNVFRRNLWLSATDRELECPGYNWLSILYYAILDSPCVYYSCPLIYQRFSGIGGYANKWPLYYVYGLGLLFEKLSASIDGLFDHWIHHSQREKHSYLVECLLWVNSSRQLYKDYYNEMMTYLVHKNDRIIFALSVFMPTWLFQRTMRRFLKFAKLTKKVLQKLNKLFI